MSSDPDNTNANDLLNDALADYMQKLDRGEAVEHEAFLAKYADVADELRAYFDGADLVEHMAGPRADHTLPSPGASAVSVPPLARIRYFGDYELLEEIARGGMGVVYKARQVSLNRVVALKMILAGQLAGEADVRRFYAEAEAAANLDHPGIVPIFEIGRYEGQHYFSMAFVEGTTVATRLAQGPLPPREAAALLKQVADAVEYAHQKGVIHRDLKPANVLIDKHGNARVTDFGLAKRVQSASDLTGTGQILGTPSYMPPEQASGKTDEVRESADVYALGAVLYAMLSGRPPFQADNGLDTLLQVIQRDPVALRQLNPKVPRDLETICLKCLEKAPKLRYRSAGNLADELTRYMEGRPILARPSGRVRSMLKWVKRHPSTAAFAAASVAATLIGLVLVTLLWRRAENALDRFSVKDYANQIALAAHAVESNNHGRADSILEQCRVDLRHWEWHWLKRRAHPLLNSWLAHTDHPVDLALSADGRTLATASQDNMVIVWEVPSGKRLQSLPQPENVRSLCLSGDGRYVATGCFADNAKSGEVIVWDARTGKRLQSRSGLCRGDGNLEISADGSWIVSADMAKGFVAWDSRTAAERFALPTDGVLARGVAISPKQDRIATSDASGRICLWDVTNQNRLLQIDAGNSSSEKLLFSPDGNSLTDGDFVWDLRTGTKRFSMPRETSRAIRVDYAFDPLQARLVASGTERTARGSLLPVFKFMDLSDGAIRKNVNAFWIRKFACSQDGSLIAAIGDQHGADADYAEHERNFTNSIRIFDGRIGSHPLPFSGGKLPVTKLLESASGHYLATFGSTPLSDPADASDLGKYWSRTTEIAVFDVRNGKRVFEDDTGRGIAWHPRRDVLAIADPQDTVRILGLPSGKQDMLLRGLVGLCRDLSWSPDGKYLAAIGSGNSVPIWDTASGTIVSELSTGATSFLRLKWSPNGKTIAVVDCKQVATLWNVPTFNKASELSVLDRALIAAFASFNNKEASAGPDAFLEWRPNSSQLALGRDFLHQGPTELMVFDVPSGQARLPSDFHARQLAFHPTGHVVAVNDDREIFVLDTRTNNELWRTPLGSGKVPYERTDLLVANHCKMAFSPDGRRLVATYLNEIQILDAADGQELLNLRAFDVDVRDVIVSRDGHTIFAGSNDGNVCAYDATPWEIRRHR